MAAHRDPSPKPRTDLELVGIVLGSVTITAIAIGCAAAWGAAGFLAALGIAFTSIFVTIVSMRGRS